VSKVKKYDLAVFIGRMAPLHNAHLENIQLADSIADRVVVILGGANAPRDERNPFSNQDRSRMVEAATSEAGIKGVGLAFINDNPSDDLWAAEIMRLANRYIMGIEAPRIAIVGHKKDDSSFYLDLFPTWEFVETGAKMHGDEEMAATSIRKLMFEDNFEPAMYMMPASVYNYVNYEFIGSPEYDAIREEYMFHQAYPAKRRASYPINDVTADAVVLCKSHILLIRRKNIPGKGKLALPGGFVNTNETVEDGAIRELDEETKLHVPEKVLRKSIIDEKRFDNPKRSLRGRLMTFAFTFKIDTNHDGSLPRVYGSDDADKAFWVPISDISAPENAADFFEDHHNIIMTMIGRAAKQQN
jgi:bifunctional NMN adenylyltransferase/nudix hydrolase